MLFFNLAAKENDAVVMINILLVEIITCYINLMSYSHYYQINRLFEGFEGLALIYLLQILPSKKR